MAPLMQPFASAPGAEATAIAAAKTAANIHFMTVLRTLETVESIRSQGGRSGVLRSKATGFGLPVCDAPASLTSVRRMASRPSRSRAVRSNSPCSVLEKSVPPFRGPTLLDHVAEHENEVRLHKLVSRVACPWHG